MTGSALAGLGTLLALMSAVWLASVVRRDASIVDIWWSLAILAAACVYASDADHLTPRRILVLAALVLWAMRLAAYLAWRGWGVQEDRRYQAMRARRPRFQWSSLFIVFWFQAVLAWVISLPLLVAMQGEPQDAPRLLDAVGALLFAIGFGFEAVGDWQMARFKADSAKPGSGSRPGPLALHAASQLLWRIRPVVGPVVACGRYPRRTLDDRQPGAADMAPAPRLGRALAGERAAEREARVSRLRRAHFRLPANASQADSRSLTRSLRRSR